MKSYFVYQKNNEKLYVQAAYLITNEDTKKREFGNLLSIKDNYPKLVVSMDEFIAGEYKGIRHLGIREFLQNDNL